MSSPLSEPPNGVAVIAAAPSRFIAGSPHLEMLGLGPDPAQPGASSLRFPDGGAWRVEIPSVEGPAALRSVLTTAAELDVPLHRVSQGSGVMMLTDGEITEMVGMCAEAGIELCLFLGPRASWDIGASRTTSGGTLVGRARGRAAVGACIEEAIRAAELGVGSLLTADEGVTWALHQLRLSGDLPATLQLKVSVQAAPANPASFRLMENLGADTINVPSDLTIEQLAELRAAGSAAIDFYLEAPDNIGGFVRHYDIAEVIRVAAPVYVKFGLRNAPDIYPSGKHLEASVVSSAAERVRRARLCLDLLERHAPTAGTAFAMSPVGSREQAPMVRLDPHSVSA
ncbi:hypothetical protein [Micromonospora sp. NPDC005113]